MPSSVDELFLLLLNPYFYSELVAGACLNKYYQEFNFILLITLELMVNVSFHDDKPYTAQKMKCSIKYFFSKFERNPFTGEILNGKLHLWCSVNVRAQI